MKSIQNEFGKLRTRLARDLATAEKAHTRSLSQLTDVKENFDATSEALKVAKANLARFDQAYPTTETAKSTKAVATSTPTPAKRKPGRPKKDDKTSVKAKPSKTSKSEEGGGSLISNMIQVMGNSVLDAAEIVTALGKAKLLPQSKSPKTYVSTLLSSNKNKFKKISRGKYAVRGVKVEAVEVATKPSKAKAEKAPKVAKAAKAPKAEKAVKTKSEAKTIPTLVQDIISVLGTQSMKASQIEEGLKSADKLPKSNNPSAYIASTLALFSKDETAPLVKVSRGLYGVSPAFRKSGKTSAEPTTEVKAAPAKTATPTPAATTETSETGAPDTADDVLLSLGMSAQDLGLPGSENDAPQAPLS